nr:hypothetical protein [Actinomyces bowdenii]
MVSLATASPAAAAQKEVDAGAQESGDGSAVVTVTVESTTASGGSEGAPGADGSGVVSQQVEATVLPICYHKPYISGADARAWVNSIYEKKKDDQKAKEAADRLYPDSEARANEGGMWHIRHCDHSRAANDEEFQAAFRAFYTANTELRLWVPAGSKPPTPPVPGSVLARAAMKAITIPSPTVETNPKLGHKGATLVGYSTWVWATGDTPASITATATAGSTTAEVTASSSGLHLSAPDSEVSCTGFGREWTPNEPDGATSDCMVSFNRSSAHLGGTTPLKVQVTYGVTWSASDGTSGTLNSVTTSSQIDIPVAEAQTLNSNDH